jgi:hypothetical protein
MSKLVSINATLMAENQQLKSETLSENITRWRTIK